jgi:hypothetical protein
LNILVQHPGRQFKAIEGRKTPFTTMSGGELPVIDRQRGYIFCTIRGGVNDGYDGCKGSGYDY